MNKIELLNDNKTLANVTDIYKDIASGDPNALKVFDGLNLDMEAIKTAINFIVSNEKLSESEKSGLLKESWRINFRAKPPTPEEFLTEKYLGPTAKTLYPRIKKCFLDFMDPNNVVRNLILYSHISFGKGNAYTEKVYTPNGYILGKDVEVGTVVCTPNGKTAKVINTLDIPNEQVYEFVFNDGRTARVGESHNWKVFYDREYQIKCEKHRVPGTQQPIWGIKTTRELLDDLEKHPNRKWHIPVAEQPIYFTEKKHSIPPYVLGALLGVGSFRSKTGGYKIVGNDVEIHERIASEVQYNFKEKHDKKYSCIYYGYLKSIYRPEIIKLGLQDTDSFTKFIPEEYLYDSVENRIALLQGLMDTDGSIIQRSKWTKDNNGITINYYTISNNLKNNVIFLVQSLGGVARVYLDKRNNKKRPCWVINILFPYNNINVFYIPRKKKILDDYYNRTIGYKQKFKSKNLIIKEIRKLEGVKGVKCIEIDDKDRLYLVGDFCVTHNSFLTTLINLFTATHVSLMRDPYKYFGLSPATLLSIMLISYSLKKSRELLLKPFNNIMEASPYFIRVPRQDTMKDLKEEFKNKDTVENLYYTTADPDSDFVFDSGLTIKTNSTVSGLLGLSLIVVSLSEIAFFTTAGKSPEYVMRIYNDSRGRVWSRMHGNYYGRTIIDSSPNSLVNPIDDWIVNESSKDPTNMLISGSVWKWDPATYKPEFDSGNIFRVYTGGKGQPPRILESDDPLLKAKDADKSKIIEVPNSMKQLFIDDLGKALKDQAGIPTGAADNIISDYSIIEDMFKNNLHNIYTNIIAPSSESPKGLIWNQIKDIFFKNVAGNYEYYYLPKIPRVVSIDQSYSTDITSISMAHIERLKDDGDNMYVIDFTIAIVPTLDKINLEAIRCFIEDLKNVGHLNISAISFDQFQSEVTIQNLERDGFNVQKISVDRTTGPYLNLISLMNRRQVAVGRNIFLKNNLKCLHMAPSGKSGKMKIDHDASRAQVTIGDSSWNNSFIGYFGKDVSDSVSAVVELCTKEFTVPQINWTGGPTKDAMDMNKDKLSAQEKTNKLMNSLGIKI